MWGVTIVETPALAGMPSLLLDAAVLGVLYTGTMRFDADPFTGFKKNLTNLRAEINATYHVRNAAGAVVVETGS